MVIEAVSRCRCAMSMRGIDFRAVMGFAIGFSRFPVHEGEFLATGVRRESRRIELASSGVSPTALCGRGAEASGDDLPVVAVDAGSGQMQHDASDRGLDPGAELHQMFAQAADLGRSEGGARGLQAQLLVEHIGRGGQQSAQLVGKEAGAAGAVNLQAVVQFFDSILDVGAGAVDHFIQMPRRLLEVRDHEARVVFRLAPGMSHDFGLDNHAPALTPSPGRITAFLVEMLRLARFARQATSGAHQACGATLKYLVFAHRDDVLESLALEEGEDLRRGKAAVEAHPQSGSGEDRAA